MRVLLLLLFINVILIACEVNKDTPPQPSIEANSSVNPISDAFYVKSTTVKPLFEAEKQIKAAGVVVSNATAQPSFKTGGILRAVNVEVGDLVKAGQRIAQLDATELLAAKGQAEAALSKAERDLTRVEVLLTDSIATKVQRDDAATGVEVAKRRLEQLTFNASKAYINAPFSGKVMRKFHNAGETVGPGMPVVLIQSTKKDDWRVRVALTDREWAQVEIGDVSVVEFDGYPGKSFPASIVSKATSANPASGSFDVELSLKQQPRALAAGLIARVKLAVKASSLSKEALTDKEKTSQLRYEIPLAALARVNGKNADVFVVGEDSMVQVRRIRLGGFNPETAEVLAGLSGKEELVTTGVTWLRDGDRVVVVNN